MCRCKGRQAGQVGGSQWERAGAAGRTTGRKTGGQAGRQAGGWAGRQQHLILWQLWQQLAQVALHLTQGLCAAVHAAEAHPAPSVPAQKRRQQQRCLAAVAAAQLDHHPAGAGQLGGDGVDVLLQKLLLGSVGVVLRQPGDLLIQLGAAAVVQEPAACGKWVAEAP